MRDNARPSRRPPLIHLIAPLILLGALTIGALRESADYFTETGILQSSDSTWVSRKGYHECYIYGTWGGATADMETEIQGTGSTPDVKNVDVAALVGVTVDTTWEPIGLGSGAYRIEVTGGDGTTLLTFTCRRITP